MKIRWYVWITALLVLAGCNDVDFIDNPTGSKGSIKATLEKGNATSRLAVGDGNVLKWAAKDAFVIFSANGTLNETWTLSQGAGESEASFTGNVIEGSLIGAAYPASANPVMEGKVLSMTLPNKLEYNADGGCDLPMWASFGNLEQGISFKHLCAMLKISVNDIPEGYKTLTVEADKPITGNFYVDVDAQTSDKILLPVEGSEGFSLVVSFDEITNDADNDRVFYLPLPVNDYGFIKVCITNGDRAVELKEWTNRSIQRRKVYWTSLTQKESDAKNTAELSAEIQGLTANNATMEITIPNQLEVTEPVTIPLVEGGVADLVMNYEYVPATTSENPLTFVGGTTTADAETDKVAVSFPKEESNPIYMEVETPQNTFTVENGYFGTVVATTATQTFIVESEAVVENLIVKGGNVIVYGEIKGSLVRHDDNADAVTKVTVMEDGILPAKIGNGIKVYSSSVSGSQSWYTNNTNAAVFEIKTREDLVGFTDLLRIGTSFEGKTIKMANDIDMYGYTFKTSGMDYYSGDGFKGTFDGQGYAVQNLNMEYEPAQVENEMNIAVGLIPIATSATIKNVTLEGGKVYVPPFAGNADKSFYVGALVGIIKGCIVENCHNVGCDVVSGYVGKVAGLIGYTRRISGSSGYVYSYIMACTNTATVKCTTTASNTAMAGGITGGGWGTNTYVVACYNSGEVSCAYASNSSYAAGIAADFGGNNYLYGCFNDAKVSGALYSGDLAGQATYSGYYRYSCYTGELFAGQDWTGESNRLELHQCTSYAEVVDILNAGIEAFNADEYATVNCRYRFVKGTTPSYDEAVNSGENSDVTNGKWDE